jgi:isoleucyl-tRNA synthetase
MIENRPDWCVSRQRAWGVPITAFFCEDCDALIMNQDTNEHIYKLFSENGADIWFERDARDLLPADYRCEKCGSQKLRKETDILDVWFDSGVSHAAVLEPRDNLVWPADLYLEGSDQHRGWFHSSLLTAVGTRQKAPYHSVLTHGFVVDQDGKKMSKSIGNIVAPEEVIKQYGAEILRLWVSASDYRDDIRISDKILKQLRDAYVKIRNTCRFLLGNISDFGPDRDAVDYQHMPDIDRFALHKLQDVIARTRKAYDTYDFHIIYHTLYNYCTVDLSAFYLDVLKDRLYTYPTRSEGRRSAQTVLCRILNAIVKLMAPILVFTAEEIWKFMPRSEDTPNSVHLHTLPEVNSDWQDAELAARWEELLDVRAEITRSIESARREKKVGHSLDASLKIRAGETYYQLLKPYQEELQFFFIVSHVQLLNANQAAADGFSPTELEGLELRVDPAEGEKCQRCWIHDLTVGSVADHPAICTRCHSALSA